LDPLSNDTPGQVTEAERIARFGHRAPVVLVDDSEAALLLERELFDRGALVGVTGASGLALAHAAGTIAIVMEAAPMVIDARRLATSDAVRMLTSVMARDSAGPVTRR
jgi:hypothetical protein